MGVRETAIGETIGKENQMTYELAPWGIIIVMAVVLAFCIPFFVYKIRNQVVEINKKMILMTEYLRMIAYGTKEERKLNGYMFK